VWVIKVYAPSDAKKNRTRSLLQHWLTFSPTDHTDRHIACKWFQLHS
jgi:hypothetical protein